MFRKFTTAAILVSVILLAGCTPGEEIPVTRTADVPATSISSTETPTTPYPEFLIGVKPEPDSSISLNDYHSVGTGYSSTVCLIYNEYSLSTSQIDWNPVWLSRDEILLEIDGHQISKANYLRTRPVLNTHIDEIIYTLGPYYYCWEVELGAGEHRATVTNLKGSSNNRQFTWTFTLWNGNEQEETRDQLCQRHSYDDWRGLAALYPVLAMDDLEMTFGPKASRRLINVGVEAWEFEGLTVNVPNEDFPGTNPYVFSYDFANHETLPNSLEEILEKYGCPGSVYAIRNNASDLDNYDGMMINYNRWYGVSFYFDQYPLTLQDEAAFSRHYPIGQDRGDEIRVFEPGVTFDYISLEEAIGE